MKGVEGKDVEENRRKEETRIRSDEVYDGQKEIGGGRIVEGGRMW